MNIQGETMSRNLVPIKVKIEKRTDNGHHKYPDFSELAIVKNTGMDWSRYVDVFGLGWHYDKKCGHQEEEVGSPLGMQWGVLIVPKEFADQAVAMYPEMVTKLTETELETFYDNRAHAHEPEEEINTYVLQAIKAKVDLGLALTPEQMSAKDPETDTPGVRKNKRKKWSDYKALTGVEIVQ
jgi:hypothetical protein